MTKVIIKPLRHEVTEIVVNQLRHELTEIAVKISARSMAGMSYNYRMED